MNRLMVMTVGKTHSGKTSFAKALEKRLPGSLVIDQDVQAEFLHTYYQQIVPREGPNLIKNALTKMIVEYAVDETACHVILSNSNRHCDGRRRLLNYFASKRLKTIIVHFDIPEAILMERIALSQRDTSILRTVSTFEQVLVQQQAGDGEKTIATPGKSEADHLFTIKNEADTESVIQNILDIVNKQKIKCTEG